MSEFINNIIYLLVVILVPIIPAYLLFKKLKSTAFASGPLSPAKELTVKFGGPFAAYFAIFFLLYFKLPNKFEQEKEDKNIYEITGKVMDAITNKCITSNDADLEVKLDPTSKIRGGEFTLYLPASYIMGREKLDYTLHIEDRKNIYLSTDGVNLNRLKDQFRNSKVISIPDSSLLMYKKNGSQADTTMITEPMKELN